MKKHFYFWWVIIFFLIGCSSTRSISFSLESKERIKASEVVKLERRIEAEKYSLKEKSEIIESRLSNFLYLPHFLISRFTTDKGRGPIQLEHSLFLLSYLASKYAVTKNKIVQTRAKRIIKSIIEMDRANGLDGFLPLEAVIDKRGNLFPTNEDTHANVYVQLLFAYTQAFYSFDDIEIKKLISKHIAIVAKHFVGNNYQLVNQYGETTKYSNISISRFELKRNRALAVTLLIHSALKFVDKNKYSDLYQRLMEDKVLLEKYGYPNKGPIFFKLANLEFPTPGSSHLNFLSLYTLHILTGDDYYKKVIKKLHSRYDHSANVFFDILYLNTSFYFISKERRFKIEDRIKDYLQSYPTVRDSSEILNSYRKDLEKRKISRYIKFRSKPESVVPLPIYDRPGTTYEWIRNQHRLDGGWVGNRHLYNEVDYLQAYWLFREYLKKIGQ